MLKYLEAATALTTSPSIPASNASQTSPQCRNAFLLSPDAPEFRFQLRG